jgi:hypothetical protein
MPGTRTHIATRFWRRTDGCEDSWLEPARNPFDSGVQPLVRSTGGGSRAAKGMSVARRAPLSPAALSAIRTHIRRAVRVRRPETDANMAARWVRSHDLGVGYALLMVLSVVVVFARPHGAAANVVLRSSTNLHNLRAQPILVLVLSAFVLSSPWSLWILPLLVWGYGSAQRWLGRTATLLVGLLGHVFATVFVAVLLTAGLAHHQLSRSITRQPDVGVSYGLAAVLGLLVFRLPAGRRRRVAVAGTLLLIALLVAARTFTDLGHLVAWWIGLCIGFVGSRAAAAGQCPAE